MSLFPGSVRQVVDATPIDIVLLGADGLPVYGFDPSRPSSAAQSELTFTGASQLIAAGNPQRRELIIDNQTNKVLYVAYAATATSATRTHTIPVGGSLHLIGGYTGDISGILQGAPNANNKVYVTEVTP